MCVSPIRTLSKDSPSGDMKAVVRDRTIKGEDKQFLEVCLSVLTVSADPCMMLKCNR